MAPDLSARFCKVNWSKTNTLASFFKIILTSLLDRGMQPLNYNVQIGCHRGLSCINEITFQGCPINLIK